MIVIYGVFYNYMIAGFLKVRVRLFLAETQQIVEQKGRKLVCQSCDLTLAASSRSMRPYIGPHQLFVGDGDSYTRPT